MEAKQDDRVILINTFKVDPSKHEELLQVLQEFSEKTVVSVPGFISAKFHVSLDGTRVVNYAVWESEKHLQEMYKREDAKPHMEAAAKLAISYEPVLYKVHSFYETNQ